MNTYTIEQRIPNVALWQVVCNDTTVVATCDSQYKAQELIEALKVSDYETGSTDWASL